MHGETRPESVNGQRGVAAKIISMIFQPMTWAGVLYALVAWHVASGVTAIVFFLVGFSFVALGPAILILLLKRWRVISDLDLSDRRERFKPYLMIVSMNSFSLVIFWVMDAPNPLVSISASYMVVTLVGGIISNYWKISMHLAGITGPVTALMMIVHPILFLLYLFCLPVGWARLFLNKHTLSQIVWGSLFSAVLTMTVIYLIV